MAVFQRTARKMSAHTKYSLTSRDAYRSRLYHEGQEFERIVKHDSYYIVMTVASRS